MEKKNKKCRTSDVEVRHWIQFWVSCIDLLSSQLIYLRFILMLSFHFPLVFGWLKSLKFIVLPIVWVFVCLTLFLLLYMSCDLKVRVPLNGELVWMWKGSVVAVFKIRYQHFSRWTRLAVIVHFILLFYLWRSAKSENAIWVPETEMGCTTRDYI